MVRIDYGPFSIRARWVFGAFFVVLAPLGAGFFLDSATLSCDAVGRCELRRGVIEVPVLKFPLSSLSHVRVETLYRSKGGPDGRAILDFRSKSVEMSDADLDSANAWAAAVNAHLGRAPAPFDAHLASKWWMALLLMIFGVFGWIFSWSELRNLGHFRLELIPEWRRLMVRRWWCGVPWGATWVLDGIRDVEVCTGLVSSFSDGKGERPRVSSQLLLLLHSGGFRELPKRQIPGTMVHYRAAVALRQALGLSPGLVESHYYSLCQLREERGLDSVGSRLVRLGIGISLGTVFGTTVGLLVGVGVALVVRWLSQVLPFEIEGFNPVGSTALSVFCGGGGGVGALAGLLVGAWYGYWPASDP